MLTGMNSNVDEPPSPTDRSRRLKVWLARAGRMLFLLAAVATLVTFVTSFVPSLPGPRKHTIGRTHSTVDFDIQSIRSKNGQFLNPGDKFTYLFGIGVPISAEGDTQLDDTVHVWVVLRDIYGSFFLQYPPLDIVNGRWTATNIRPLNDIAQIQFYLFGEEGHHVLTAIVIRGDFGSLSTIPADTTLLGAIELQ